ncbi:mycothiol transferase [Actinopolymorpha singaporensis]|uniref:DinB superfamily protein n=1 Tax=Actinopolymorpha singaporensis TaxID=117157 RepID=A0A1H1T9C3_9ACTN|nr:DUF664 domain-containing protein [Actinopolymorpha singaporensis]SDS56830.1 Protein of unknown function [Actinopolymorpha singaporensis]
MTAQLSVMTADTLLLSLAAQQRRIVGILDGLSDDALRRPVLPSGWSCVGMVSHLTVGTRFWFVEVMTGVRTGPAVEDDFHVPASVPAASILDTYRQEGTEAIAAVRELPLDSPPAWWPEGMFGDWRMDNFLEVLQHVLVETACHAGHLDAARELIDGRTWDWEHGRLADPR